MDFIRVHLSQSVKQVLRQFRRSEFRGWIEDFSPLLCISQVKLFGLRSKMSTEVILGVVAIAVSVLSALWTAYSSWQQGREEKLTVAARAKEALHVLYSKDAQRAITFISIYAQAPGTQDFNQNLANFMKNPQNVSGIL